LDEDDTEMLKECTGVVEGLNTNLNAYAEKQRKVGATGAAIERREQIEETPKKFVAVSGLDMDTDEGDLDEGDLDKTNGGKKQRRKKTRKVKKHHRKSIKRVRARKFTMKYKYISKKNTRRR